LWRSLITILAWLILGLIAGWLASLLIGAGWYGLTGDMVVGMLGALVSGWLALVILGLDMGGPNLTSAAIAAAGAIVLTAAFRGLAPGRRSAV
jgi:uncharacterized membrane protein YeaQ/YmgE (transglycosylase-associated protein family)